MLGAESWGSELGVDDAGVFLPLRNPLNVSASCVNGFFFGEVVLVEVLGVALLPSSVTSPSVGPESDSVDAGASVEDVPGPDDAFGGTGSAAPIRRLVVVHLRLLRLLCQRSRIDRR